MSPPRLRCDPRGSPDPRYGGERYYDERESLEQGYRGRSPPRTRDDFDEGRRYDTREYDRMLDRPARAWRSPSRPTDPNRPQSPFSVHNRGDGRLRDKFFRCRMCQHDEQNFPRLIEHVEETHDGYGDL